LFLVIGVLADENEYYFQLLFIENPAATHATDVSLGISLA
jgi:hypothetical protein